MNLSGLIQLDDIRMDVNVDHLHPQIEIKDIKFFANQDNKNDLEDKGLALLILQCMPGESTSMKSPYGQQQKKTRTSFASGKPYHRWFLCADLANPPHCFAVITDNLSQTNRLLIHNLDDTYMGRSFYLVEPTTTRDKQGNYLHLLHCEDTALLPLKWNVSALAKPARIDLPPTAEETFYFVLENQQINLLRIRAPSDPSCTGFQCDRQKKKGECLCLNLIPGSPLVYSFDVEFEVDPRLFGGSRTHVIQGFRSYRTTAMFFKNFPEFSNSTNADKERSAQQDRRKFMKRIARYVNDHGGWKIIGWCRKGKISVEGESERVENTQVNLNLSYVYPSNFAIFSDPEFLALQIRNDDAPTTTPAAANSVAASNSTPVSTSVPLYAAASAIHAQSRTVDADAEAQSSHRHANSSRDEHGKTSSKRKKAPPKRMSE